MNSGNKNRVGKKGILAGAGLLLLLAAIAAVTRFIDSESASAVGAYSEEIIDLGKESDVAEAEYSCMELYGEDYVYYNDIENYLFLGTDNSGNEEATGGDYRGSMADYIALLVVDRTAETYAVLQLNRDTMTEMEVIDDGEYITAELQLCCGHWYGSNKEESCELMSAAVSELFDMLPIDGYYAFPMKEIPQLNHLVGGVTVTIEEDFSEVDPTLKMGETICLSDEQAYTFLHSRFNVGDENNTSRMERQTQYLEEFMQLAKEKTAEDASFAANAYDQFSAVATTDMSAGVMSKLAKRLAGYSSLGIYHFEGETAMGKTLGDEEEHVEFFLDESSVIEIMTKLYGLVPDPEAE